MNTERIVIREDETSYLDSYLLSKEIRTGVTVKRPALIILPGGAYLYKSYREGEPVAMQFAALGYQCFVFTYPTLWPKKYERMEDVNKLNPPAPYPEQVLDLYKAIAHIRENADELGIAKDQIYVLGFSAGGHIAGSAAVNWKNEDYLRRAGIKDPELSKPNGAVLCYPMVDAELIRIRKDIGQAPPGFEVQAAYMLQSVFGTDEPTDEQWEEMDLTSKITKDTPPIFLWHTFEDQVTYAKDTTRFVERLLENKVTCEYHLFATGHHGMGLSSPAVATEPGDFILNNAIWPVLADLFLKRLPIS